MKIGIYLEPGGNALGGSEYCAAVLAEAFAREHRVEIVHHKPSLRVEALVETFGTELRGTTLRYEEPSTVPKSWGVHKPWERLALAKAWQADFSRPYDLFIAITHNVPPFCHAPAGLLMVLFPFFEREEDVIFRKDSSIIARHVKRAYYRWEWRARMRSYGRRTSISEFTRRWTRRRWDVDTTILNPPAGTVAADVPPKERALLSVGRFTTHAHPKRQVEMIEAFGRLRGSAEGWSYRSVGGISELPEDRAFFDRAAAAAGDNGATVETNITRARLDALFRVSSIFWHAAGYGLDEDRVPELMEHYGITTVEAMCAGCVPVVINRGGQREIVQHGVNGFLWDTLDELCEYTALLMRDDALRDRMSRAALDRAQQLSKPAFVNKAMQLIAPLLS